MPQIAFRKISKKFGAVSVIENLDLDIADGEFVVLLGPSGCGKTTLLNLLSGLLEVDAGEIMIGERDVTDLDPKDRGLAMVFQSYALYPTKTVRGNLKFGLSARRISSEEIERRINWAARLLQIDQLLDRKPSQLSGGQRQRVAIGRALVKQVGVCLFDEPLSNLDAKLRTEMRIEIKKLHNQLKNTVVYVTHDQVEAMTMATKIAVMNKGVIQQVGTPDQIYDTPENTFVADFVGSPTINMVECTLQERSGGWSAVSERDGISFDLVGYKWRSPAEANQRVKVAFRAEHFLPINGTVIPSGVLKLERPVDYYEKSGADAIAFLSLPSGPISVRIEGRHSGQYRGAETMPALLELSKINVFDARSGRRM